MAPIRRYLRITRYSVLEVRIYLDNPALGASWLLNTRNPVLPRVIEAVRPLVLPKLREESARERGKVRGSKKKGVKDVVVEDDFEVSIFLTETSTRHSLLTKQKHFREKDEDMRSNSNKLTGAGATSDEAINVDDGIEESRVPLIQREDSDENIIDLKDIPPVEEDEDNEDISETVHRMPKRERRHIETEDDDDGTGGLFVENADEDEEPLPKRVKGATTAERDGPEEKKKMAMETSYDGFSIYGRVLCLVVKRRGKAKSGMSGGQAMMEEWITSTQMPPVDDDGP